MSFRAAFAVIVTFFALSIFGLAYGQTTDSFPLCPAPDPQLPYPAGPMMSSTVRLVSFADSSTIAIQPIAPGELIKVSGFWSTTDGGFRFATTDPLTTEMDGVEVLINGSPAPLTQVGWDVQLPYLFTAVAQVPDLIPGTLATVQVRLKTTDSKCLSNAITTDVVDAVPTLMSNGTQPIIATETGELVTAAAIGSYVTFYGLGFGMFNGFRAATVAKTA